MNFPENYQTVLVYGEFSYSVGEEKGINFFFFSYPTNGKIKKDWRGKEYKSTTPVKGLQFSSLMKKVAQTPLLEKRKMWSKYYNRYRKEHPFFNIEAIEWEDAKKMFENDLNKPGENRRIWIWFDAEGNISYPLRDPNL